MRFFTEEQVRKLLEIDKLIAAVRAAFAGDFLKTLRMPPRTRFDLGESILLLMPCHDVGLNAAGVKLVTVNPRGGVNAGYVLLDPQSGQTLAILEANYLTDVRTAATSAVATDLLARPDAQNLGVFGTGRQALAHFTVLSRVRSFRRFLVCSSGRSDTGDFASRAKDMNINVEIVDRETCVRESDVICTCTTSHEPLFDGRWIRPGTHLNLIGAFQAHTREVDDETIRRSKIVVDTYQGVLAEAGDLLIPLEKRLIQRTHILSDLHELAAGKKSVRTSSSDITLFKSVGCALEDLIAARLVYQAA
jgi:ornithine cyclodeaminase/alanine dehydrogenase-like protein (mu-crystallin family)